MPRSGSETREALVRAGERLFAANGIDATTTTSLVEEAGQRNNNAVGFHFGDKDGLVAAILDKHQRVIDDDRRARLASLPAAVDADVVARALVEPLVDRLRDVDGGAAYVRIQAEVAGRTRGALPPAPPEGLARLLELALPFAAGLDEPDFLLHAQVIFIVAVQGLAAFLDDTPAPDDATIERWNEVLVNAVAVLLTGAAGLR
ncbi:MAG: TetR/AcrR family transcriptional regulator [Actinomycetota bacterium]